MSPGIRRIRLRGLDSVLRDPVVIVDSVRIHPDSLSKIDPTIIEKAEAFRGPSAVALYGTDAANGVIIVTTKKKGRSRVEQRREPASRVVEVDSATMQPIKHLKDLLDNRVHGMTLYHTTDAPGDSVRIRLRGLNRVLRSNNPVVIVDGVRVYRDSLNQIDPLGQIDPNIIEKVEVFKGPSAAALYGADAANGVIVVTTKKEGRSK